MKIFIDSADIDEIKLFNSIGIIDGVTTNPSLVSKVSKKYQDLVYEICNEVNGPVSAEVKSNDVEGMVKEGRDLAQIATNVVIKIPLTIDGLKACRQLVDQGYKVNITLCFSANQALLAAKAGANYVSPFVGRLDDISTDGMQLIDDICTIFNNYPTLNTQVIVASIRNPNHILESAKIGAHIATIPAKVLYTLASHPLTDKGVQIFNLAWKE